MYAFIKVKQRMLAIEFHVPVSPYSPTDYVPLHQNDLMFPRDVPYVFEGIFLNLNCTLHISCHMFLTFYCYKLAIFSFGCNFRQFVFSTEYVGHAYRLKRTYTELMWGTTKLVYFFLRWMLFVIAAQFMSRVSEEQII